MNDNIIKQALIVMIIFSLLDSSDMDPGILVTIAAGIFILPFFLFSATAGQIADKFEKSATIQHIKFIEILIMVMACFGFYLSNTWFLILVLFLMGTQSSFFGPLKYGILPNHLKEGELLAGNALIEAGTFLAILIGTIKDSKSQKPLVGANVFLLETSLGTATLDDGSYQISKINYILTWWM